MTGPFVLIPSAARDLDEILEYVLEHGGAGPALHLHNCLYEGFSRIGGDDLADESLRVWSGFAYLIIYRPETKPVQILRVIHGARDLPKALGEHR